MDKISTQAMSVSDGNTSGLSFTKTQQQVTTPFDKVELSSFTRLQRNELKQMMREVLSEYITPQHNRNDVIERIRDDYHHGGYDEYK